MASLLQAVKDDLGRYFRHMARRVERAVRALPREKVYLKPYPYGNSVGHLVLHLTGNLNHYVGALVAGTGYVRNREREFTEPHPPTPEEALLRFHEAVEMVIKTMDSMDEQKFVAPISDQPPVQTTFGLLLVCAAHLNNHIGQMAYLVQAHGHSTEEPPMW
jgi:uncharacterized damage-inducible protein DinB